LGVRHRQIVGPLAHAQLEQIVGFAQRRLSPRALGDVAGGHCRRDQRPPLVEHGKAPDEERARLAVREDQNLFAGDDVSLSERLSAALVGHVAPGDVRLEQVGVGLSHHVGQRRLAGRRQERAVRADDPQAEVFDHGDILRFLDDRRQVAALALHLLPLADLALQARVGLGQLGHTLFQRAQCDAQLRRHVVERRGQHTNLVARFNLRLHRKIARRDLLGHRCQVQDGPREPVRDQDGGQDRSRRHDQAQRQRSPGLGVDRGHEDIARLDESDRPRLAAEAGRSHLVSGVVAVVNRT